MTSRVGFMAGTALSLVIGTPVAGIALAVPAAADDNTKQNMITFFMETGCPTGWSEYKAGQGRLLLGITDSTKFTVGSTGGGNPLTDQEDRTHTHQYQTSVDVGSKDIEANGCCNNQGSGPGKKSVPETQPGTTADGSSNTPLIQLTVCQRTDPPTDPNASDPYPMGALAFFDSKTCPAGSDPDNPDWQVASFGKNDLGYFLMPFFDPPAATLGATVGTGMSPGESRTHDHAYSSSISVSAVEYAGAWGCYDVWPVKLCNPIATSGTKDFTGTSVGSTAGMPYLTLLMCQKASFTVNDNPPPNVPQEVVTFFTAQTCPTGWKMTEATTGRYLVGLPAGGIPGASFGGNPLKPTESAPTPVVEHDHTFSGKVTAGSKGVGLASGCCAHDAGGADTYDYSGTTNAASAGLPYYGVIQCQPCTENDPDQACKSTQ